MVVIAGPWKRVTGHIRDRRHEAGRVILHHGRGDAACVDERPAERKPCSVFQARRLAAAVALLYVSARRWKKTGRRIPAGSLGAPLPANTSKEC